MKVVSAPPTLSLNPMLVDPSRDENLSFLTPLKLVSGHGYPVSYENGDPRSPFLYEIRDLGPQFNKIWGTIGSPISYDIRDPSMKLGTHKQLWLSLQDAEFPGYMHCVHCAGVVA